MHWSIGFLRPLDLIDRRYDPIIRQAKLEHHIPLTTEPGFEKRLKLIQSYLKKKDRFKKGQFVFVNLGRNNIGYKSSSIQ